MPGKISEKSGNFEVDEKWQPCCGLLGVHSKYLCSISEMVIFPRASLWTSSKICAVQVTQDKFG